MKYILIIFLFSCSQPSGKIIIGEDSTGITSGPATLRIQPSNDSGGFTGLTFYPIIVKSDSGSLYLSQDGKIKITGDTMKVIRTILKNLLQKSDRETQLENENQELRKLIQGLKKQHDEIQHIRVTTDL